MRVTQGSTHRFEGLVVWGPWILGLSLLLWQVSFQFVYGLLADPVQKELGLTAFEAAALVSLYLLVYGLMQLPAGIVIDRLGVRWLLPVVGVLSAASVVAFAFAQSFSELAASRIAAGFFMAFVFPAMGKIARRRLPERRFALAMALADMCFGAGAVIASGLVLLIEPSAWRSLVIAQGVMGGVLALILLAGLAPLGDRPASAVERDPVGRVLREALRRRELVLGLLVYVWGAGLTFGFGGYWNLKLQESCGCTAPQVSELTTALFAGLSVGMLAAGLLGGQRSRIRPTLIAGSLTGLVTVSALLAYSSDLSLFWMGVLNFLLGTALGTCSLAFAVAGSATPPRQAATVVAVVNAGGCLGGALFQELPVWLAGGTASLWSVSVVYGGVALLGVVVAFCLPREAATD